MRPLVPRPCRRHPPRTQEVAVSILDLGGMQLKPLAQLGDDLVFRQYGNDHSDLEHARASVFCDVLTYPPSKTLSRRSTFGLASDPEIPLITLFKLSEPLRFKGCL